MKTNHLLLGLLLSFFVKVCIIPATLADTVIFLTLASVCAYFEYKLENKQVAELKKTLTQHAELLKSLDERAKNTEERINAVKMIHQMKTNSLNQK